MANAQAFAAMSSLVQSVASRDDDDDDLGLENNSWLPTFYVIIAVIFALEVAAKLTHPSILVEIPSPVRTLAKHSHGGWHHEGIDTLDIQWRRKYRMSWASFCGLVDMLQPYIIRPATVVQYTKWIIKVLAHPDMLCYKFISWPTRERQQYCSTEFQKITGLPNVVGCIDGSHIKLWQQPSPEHTPAAYWCRHDIHSIILQGVVDVDQNFIDVSCRTPGGQHDATILRDNSLLGKLTTGDLLKSPIRKVQGVPGLATSVDLPPYLLGDCAYPLMPFLMKPFKRGRGPEKSL